MKITTPSIQDFHDVYQLVIKSPPLEANSEYAYMLMCTHFQDSCVIAKNDDNEVVGFVLGYKVPKFNNLLFVWQVAVAPSMRGKSLGVQMLTQLLQKDFLQDILFVDTTIALSNEASQKMFQKWADSLQIQIQVVSTVDATLFGNAHESEDIYRIGPIKKKEKK